MHGVDQAGRQPVPEVQLQVDAAADRRIEEVREARHGGRQIDRLRLKPALAREGEELAREPRGAIRRGPRHVQPTPHVGRLDLAVHQLVTARDHLQEVVEIMREACRELAHGFHLLSLAIAVLRVPPAGHVELGAKK